MTKKLYGKNDFFRFSTRESQEINGRTHFRRDFARLIHSPSFRRLQGKTQLFPGIESDFFRNRLTHSLEVAQIAKSLAIALNDSEATLRENPIDVDVVEFAGLAHDLGHPPFGHNGEAALDEIMRKHGGFEGNAQTLRILSVIEKKVTDTFPANPESPQPTSAGLDRRHGLDLCARSLASILKYDNQIPAHRTKPKRGKEFKPIKGYYQHQHDLVLAIREKLCCPQSIKLKTIECQLMDIADDIAYSTYDIEDSFKAGFLSPAAMISMEGEFKEKIVQEVCNNIERYYPKAPNELKTFTIVDLNQQLIELFEPILDIDGLAPDLKNAENDTEVAYLIARSVAGTSKNFCEDGYFRTKFTSELVDQFMNGVEFEYNHEHPALSTAKLKLDIFKKVEMLKHFAFQHLISSPRLKLAEFRGKEIIKAIFSAFQKNTDLLPADCKLLYDSLETDEAKNRVICDYVAGMTDRYCVEMYSRLTGENPTSFWKPH